MKKLILSIPPLVLLAGMTCLGIAWGQGGADPAAPSAHKVALIDMTYLFGKYDKFKTLREDLMAEVEAFDQKLKQKGEQIKAIAAELKTFEQGSADYIAREKQITQLSASAKADRETAQRDFMRKESKIYQTTYGEVSDAVAKYAKIYKYTLVIRFTRDDASSDEPQKVLQSLQKPVVFYRTEDDITDPVLTYLNKLYAQSTAASPAPRTKSAIKPVSGTRNN